MKLLALNLLIHFLYQIVSDFAWLLLLLTSELLYSVSISICFQLSIISPSSVIFPLQDKALFFYCSFLFLLRISLSGWMAPTASLQSLTKATRNSFAPYQEVLQAIHLQSRKELLHITIWGLQPDNGNEVEVEEI